MAGLLASGLVGLLTIHLLEPRLAITWSYAHLGRAAALRWIAVGLIMFLPLAAAFLWRLPGAHQPTQPMSKIAITAIAFAGWIILTTIGFSYPAPILVVYDTTHLVQQVAKSGEMMPRWYLAVWFYRSVATLFLSGVSPTIVVRSVNVFCAAVAFFALAGAARCLGSTRGEAVSITLLAWTALGSLQLAFGYQDVYPVALAGTVLYLWAGLGAVRGRHHPVWPLTIAGIGPFFYIGLVLLMPSLIVIGWAAMRRPGGILRLGSGIAIALLVAGAATLPGYGTPFAWAEFARHAATASASELGLSPTSSLLPLPFMLSGLHAREVLHTLILVDGVGVLLLVVGGAWHLLRSPRVLGEPAVLFLGLVVSPFVAYVVAMDPVYGAYLDWDLFSYGAAATSLLGGYAFVCWGRHCPRPFAVLLGIALATSGVHLLARLNALDVHRGSHVLESRTHLSPRTYEDGGREQLDVWIEAEPDEGPPPLRVQFTSEVEPSEEEGGGPYRYQWDFGDGSMGAGANPVHTYHGVDDYTVTLVVYDDRGNDGSDDIDVWVEEVPH